MAYAAARSPFYRDKFAAAGLRGGWFRSLDDLRRMPLTSKDEVAVGGTGLWCATLDAVVDICTTSGTTGAPLLYPLTRRDVERLGYNEYLSFVCAGLRATDVVLLATTMDRCFMAGLAYFEGLKRLGATVIRVGSGAPAMLLSFLDNLKPTAIVSVPSFLTRVAQYAHEHRVDAPNSSIEKLVCIGEPVRNADLTLNPLGKRVGELWGAAVYSTYASTEMATSMCECDAGCGGHSHPELLHVEILDDDGRPVPDGEVGELVATTIGVEALPLIRYRTGDCTTLRRTRCACGRWTPRIGPIVGRKSQMMKIKGTSVYPAAVQKVLDSYEQIVDYVMIATSVSALSDELSIAVVVRGDASGLERRIDDHFQGQLKVKPAVRIASRAEVESLQDSQSLRKKRVFIDRRSKRESK
jgi:phenylacetate-CoA ligase